MQEGATVKFSQTGRRRLDRPSTHVYGISDPPQQKEDRVTKIVDCNKVNPTSGCQHVVRGETEEELLKNAAEHAKEHGMEPTPELLQMVKGHIEEDK
jgi:predicted small metal-binding protein